MNFFKGKSTKAGKDQDENIVSTDNKGQLPIMETLPRATQQLTRGSRKLNIENADINLQRLRKLLPDENLVIDKYIIGQRTKTKIYLVYLQDVANPGIVNEVKSRLENIEAEVILESSYIERNLENSQWSPFPQLEKTLRMEVLISALCQGRTGVIVDGSPQILMAPTTLFDILDTFDDASRRWFFASSFFRIARLILLFIACFLPGFYIALTSFNTELIPTQLAFTITTARVINPFPIYAEAFIMMGVIEAVRMVILRLPSSVGQTVALFSGITLVIAGLAGSIVSSPVVIIVTLTIIASFTLPDFDLRSSVRMIQFFTMIMATVFGLFGLALSFFYLAIHLCTLKSLGIPYLTPMAPFEPNSWGHTILREGTKEMAQDKTYKPQNKK